MFRARASLGMDVHKWFWTWTSRARVRRSAIQFWQTENWWCFFNVFDFHNPFQSISFWSIPSHSIPFHFVSFRFFSFYSLRFHVCQFRVCPGFFKSFSLDVGSPLYVTTKISSLFCTTATSLSTQCAKMLGGSKTFYPILLVGSTPPGCFFNFFSMFIQYAFSYWTRKNNFTGTHSIACTKWSSFNDVCKYQLIYNCNYLKVY